MSHSSEADPAAPALSHGRFPTLGAILLYLASAAGEDVLFPDSEERRRFFVRLRRLSREQGADLARLVGAKDEIAARMAGLAADTAGAEFLSHTLNELYAFYINIIAGVAIPCPVEARRVTWVLSQEAVHIVAEELVVHLRRRGGDRSVPQSNPLWFLCSPDTEQVGPFPALLDWLQSSVGCRTRRELARYVADRLRAPNRVSPEALHERFRSWEDGSALPERETLDDLCLVDWGQTDSEGFQLRLRQRRYLARFVQFCLSSARELWGPERLVALVNTFVEAIDSIGEKMAAAGPSGQPDWVHRHWTADGSVVHVQAEPWEDRLRDVAEAELNPQLVARFNALFGRLNPLVRRHRRKGARDRAQVEMLIDRLRRLGACSQTAEYLILAGEAAHYVFQGLPDEAFERYYQAFLRGKYRAGDNLVPIIRGALVTGSFVLKKLRRNVRRQLREVYSYAQLLGLVDADGASGRENAFGVLAERYLLCYPPSGYYPGVLAGGLEADTATIGAMLQVPPDFVDSILAGPAFDWKAIGRSTVDAPLNGYGPAPLSPLQVAAGRCPERGVERILGLGANVDLRSHDGVSAALIALSRCYRARVRPDRRLDPAESKAVALKIVARTSPKALGWVSRHHAVSALSCAIDTEDPELVAAVAGRIRALETPCGRYRVSALLHAALRGYQIACLVDMTADDTTLAGESVPRRSMLSIQAFILDSDLQRLGSTDLDASLLPDACRHLDKGASFTDGLYSALASPILERGARADPTYRDGSTPLILAGLGGLTQLADLLLRHGANPSTQNSAGYTVLSGALHAGHFATALELLGHDMRLVVNVAASRRRLTPLGLAIVHLRCRTGPREQMIQIIRKCLDYGAHVDRPDWQGSSPIQLARSLGDPEVLRMMSTAAMRR